MILLFTLSNAVAVAKIIAISIIGIVILGSGIFIYIYKFKKNKGAKEDLTDYSGLSRYDTKDYIKIDDIDEDMIIVDGGYRFIAGVTCFGNDFYSAPASERLAIKNGYTSFISTLKSPMVYRQFAKAVDLNKQIKRYEKNTDKVREQLVSFTMDYDEMKMECEKAKINEDYQSLEILLDEMGKKATQIDVLNARIKHLSDQIEYMYVLSNGGNSIDREETYFFDWSYTPDSITTELTLDEIKDRARTELKNKTNAIIGTLANARVRARRITSEELEIIYKRYLHPVTGEMIQYGQYIDNSDFLDIMSAPKEDEIYNEAVSELADDLALSALSDALSEMPEEESKEPLKEEPVKIEPLKEDMSNKKEEVKQAVKETKVPQQNVKHEKHKDNREHIGKPVMNEHKNNQKVNNNKAQKNDVNKASMQDSEDEIFFEMTVPLDNEK